MVTQKGAKTSKAKKPAVKKRKDTTRKATPKKAATRSKALTPKPEELVKSGAYQQAMVMAEEYTEDPEVTTGLVEEALRKAKKLNVLGGAWNYLTNFSRMVKSYIKHEYTEVPVQSIVAATGALIYFVIPTDLIPDFLPGLGYLDDAGVFTLVAASIKLELDAFLAWEATRRASKLKRKHKRSR